MEKFSVDQSLNPALYSAMVPDLILSQPEKGYRFSMDPFILFNHIVNHIQLSGVCRVIDVGTGCGIIALLLANKFPDLLITGIEIQKELAQFARQNVRKNRFEKQVNILCKDINHVTTDLSNGKADLLICNPPYKKKDTGRLNPDSQKAIARHEISLNLDQLFNCANRLLHKNGRISMIFPAERLHDLEQAMADHGFFAQSIQLVYTQKNSPGKRLILCAVKNNNQPCTFLPPVRI
ncbi:MAG: methyltransferase [Pseudomonadota bacterium]